MTGHLRHPWRLIAPFVLLLLVPQVLLVWPGWTPPRLAENRVLASAPEPLASLADLDRFRADTDAWVADRFPARTLAIVGLNVLRYRLGYSGTANVRVGGGGWLFYDNGDHLPQLRASTLSNADTRSWTHELLRREESLAALGIPYFVLAPPVKERVYPERLADWLRHPAGLADADVLLAASRLRGSSSLLTPVEDLLGRKAAGAALYTPFDTHWTGHGAYSGYRALLEAMADAGLPVRVRALHGFSVREPEPALRDKDLVHMLGIAPFVDQRFVYLEDAGIQASLRSTFLTDAEDWTADRVLDTGRDGPVLLFTGDSFSTALVPLLLPHFSRVVFSHHQNGFHREDLIQRFKPDVVVLQVLESNLRHSMRRPTAVEFAAMLDHIPGARVIAPWIDQEADLSAGRATYQCSLDQWTALDAQEGRFRLSGWFADVAGGEVPATVDVVLQSDVGAWGFAVPVDRPRQDVAEYFGVDSIGESGFDAVVDAGSIPSGEYAVHLQSDVGARNLRCRTTTIVILPRLEGGDR